MTWSKVKIPVLEVIKWLLVIGAVVFLYFSSAQGRESQTEFSVMSEAVAGAADLSTMQEADNQMSSGSTASVPMTMKRYCCTTLPPTWGRKRSCW